MTREIKFRVWTGEEMLHLCLGHVEWDHADTHKIWEVMQYTGLKDKNGKEIYEGDIVQDYDVFSGEWMSGLIKVYWRTESCGFEPYSDCRGNCGCCAQPRMPECTRVVGNIYENPELLK